VIRPMRHVSLRRLMPVIAASEHALGFYSAPGTGAVHSVVTDPSQVRRMLANMSSRWPVPAMAGNSASFQV